MNDYRRSGTDYERGWAKYGLRDMSEDEVRTCGGGVQRIMRGVRRITNGVRRITKGFGRSSACRRGCRGEYDLEGEEYAEVRLR